MRILLTNDDGVYAPGLRTLRTELQKLGEVAVVAPAAEQSAVGHSITLLTPLLVQDVLDEHNRPMGHDLLDDMVGQVGGAREVERLGLGVLQRDGDAGTAEERSFDGRRTGPRVEDVDACVRPRVQAADNQIGRFGKEFQESQLDTIGRPALHGPSQELPLVIRNLLALSLPQTLRDLPVAIR